MTSTRNPSLAEVVNRAVQLSVARLFAVRVGRIESFDASAGTASVQPLQHEDGPVPVVQGVPVISLSGGQFALTMPVQPGDECLLLCADRSIDLWFATGLEGDTGDARRHNLSDAIAIVGLKSSPKALTQWPLDRVELGRQTGPRVAVTATQVHLGAQSGIDATQSAVLGDYFLAQLNTLHAAVQSHATSMAALNTALVTMAGVLPTVTGPLGVAATPVQLAAAASAFTAVATTGASAAASASALASAVTAFQTAANLPPKYLSDTVKVT